jgi:Protein of unknown function (DUF4242)
MAEFLVELYLSSADPTALANTAQRAQRAAARLTADGTPVRFVRSIFVPSDETCLFLYEAESIDAVRAAALRAGLSVDHLAETAVDTYAKEESHR